MTGTIKSENYSITIFNFLKIDLSSLLGTVPSGLYTSTLIHTGILQDKDYYLYLLDHGTEAQEVE